MRPRVPVQALRQSRPANRHAYWIGGFAGAEAVEQFCTDFLGSQWHRWVALRHIDADRTQPGSGFKVELRRGDRARPVTLDGLIAPRLDHGGEAAHFRIGQTFGGKVSKPDTALGERTGNGE